MDPTAVAAGLSSLGQVAGTVVNSASTLLTNRAQRRWSERMYERQKNDNLAFWNLTNEYNSPQAQMQRYRDAGLNPNLIYGNGSSSAGQAGSISTPDVQPVQYRTPEFGGAISGGLQALSLYQDLRIKQAQYDIMKQQANNMAVDNSIKMFQSGILGQKFSAGNELYGTRIASEKADLERTRANIDFTRNQQQLNSIKNATDVKVALSTLLSMEKQRAKSDAEIEQIKQATINLKKDEALKDIDLRLRQMGIMPGSPAWMNVVGTFFDLLMNRN